MSTGLPAEFTTLIATLQSTLNAALRAAGAETAQPQQMGRALTLDKSLSWKIAHIARATDHATVVQLLPGEAAVDILLAALSRVGVEPGLLKSTRRAFNALRDAQERLAGDRASMELIADALPSDSRQRLLRSRKLAFRGASAIWGVQARTRVNVSILTPAPEKPDFISAALIGGWVELRRIRVDARWVLFRRKSYRRDSQPVEGQLPLDPDCKDPAMLLQPFCSRNAPPILMSEEDGQTIYELGASPLANNAGAFTLHFGSRHPAIGSRYADEHDQSGELFATISAPVETLLFDVIAHRDCLFALNAEAFVFGNLGLSRHERDRLPFALTTEEIAVGAPSPHSQQHSALIEYVLALLGYSPGDFRARRYTLEYPPFPSTCLLRFPLESRPA